MRNYVKMDRKDCLEVSLNYMWCALEKADDSFDALTEEQTAYLINKFSDIVWARVIRSSNAIWDSREDIEICTYVDPDKNYVLVIEDQYCWYENWLEEMINDIANYELEAIELDKKFL